MQMKIMRAEMTSTVTDGCNRKAHIGSNSCTSMHVQQQIKYVAFGLPVNYVGLFLSAQATKAIICQTQGQKCTVRFNISSA